MKLLNKNLVILKDNLSIRDAIKFFNKNAKYTNYKGFGVLTNKRGKCLAFSPSSQISTQGDTAVSFTVSASYRLGFDAILTPFLVCVKWTGIRTAVRKVCRCHYGFQEISTITRNHRLWRFATRYPSLKVCRLGLS